MPWSPCLTCNKLFSFERGEHSTRCDECRRAHNRENDHRRGTARERGYNAEYDRNRALLRGRTKYPQCVHCGEAIDLGISDSSPMGFSADHEIPLSQGGTNHLDNLRPCHLRCNKRRQAT